MKKRFLLTLLMLALVLSVAVISVAAAAPAGLGVEDGKLTGTESGKTYEYAKVTFPAGTVDEASYADYSAESTTLAAGVYSVRVKGETDAATVWVKGTNYGTITWASNDTPTQGAWTLVDSNGTAYKPGNPFVEDGGGGGNKGEPYGFAHQIFADSANKGLMQTAYLDSVYTYFFKDDEIVNASDFAGFEFRKDNGWGGYEVVSANNTVYGRVTAYVYGGTQASYTVPFTWKTDSTQNRIFADFSSVMSNDTEGYVYKIEIDLHDTTHESYAANITHATFTKDTSGDGKFYTYIRLKFYYTAYPTDATAPNQRILLGIRVPEAAPVLSAEVADVDGTYRIAGLDATKNYAISDDGINYENVASGSSYVDVVAGTYYIYTKGTGATGNSVASTITISGAQPAIADGAIYFDNATRLMKGFDALDASKNVEFGKLSVDGKLTWISTVDAATLDSGYGYFAFRYAADGELAAGANVYVFAYEGGSNKGTISFKAGGKVDAYVKGQWTGLYLPNSAGVMSLSQEGSGKRIASGLSTKKAIADAAYIGYRYQLQDNEIFPLSELKSLTFSLGFSNGALFNVSKYPGYVRLYVAGADEFYYDVPFTMEGDKVITTVPVYTIWEDEVAADPNFIPEGYVVAWDIRYFRADQTEGLTIAYVGLDWQYPVLNTNGIDTTTLMTSKFVTLKEAIEIEAVSAVPAVGTYGGEITGLNPNVTYLLATYDKTTGAYGEWAPVTGVALIKGLPAGSYAIRSVATATDPDYTSSGVTVVEIGTFDVQGRDTVKMSKIILPEDVSFAEAEYVFNVDNSRWINRLAVSNIVYDSPNSNVVFESKNYKFTVATSDIDLTLDAAHYFDMKVTFDGESAYDRMYDKMAAVADEKELVKGVHFESSTKYFFEKGSFSVYLGEKYNGYEVEICSFNERVSRLRTEETVTVEDGWATFSVFGGDYVIVSPAYAKDN